MNSEKLFSEEELAAIEEMGAHGFIVSEIAEVIEKIDPCSYKNNSIIALMDPDNDGYKSYRKGFLKSQLELRQRIFIDAKHGSSPAQTLAAKILDEAEYQMHE